MRRCKRVLLCLCVLIVLAIGYMIWSSRGTPTVAISFVGYTNSPVMPFGGGRAPAGVIRITNTGPVGLLLWGVYPSWRRPHSSNDSPRGWYSMPILPAPVMTDYSTPQILKPGETLNAEVPVLLESDSWQADIVFSRWGLRELFCRWAYSTGNSSIQREVEEDTSRLEISVISFGPVTNQMPTNIWFRRN